MEMGSVEMSSAPATESQGWRRVQVQAQRLSRVNGWENRRVML